MMSIANEHHGREPSGEAHPAGSADEPGTLRVAIVAANCSLRMGGESALPYQYFRLLRRREVDVHLVAHQRNREELEQAFPEDRGRLHFIPDNLLHRVLYQIGRWLPVRVNRATLGGVLLVVSQAQQRGVLRWLVRTRGISVVHQPYPVSPAEPSMIYGVGAPVVIGPMNGGMDYPPGFRDREGLWERSAVFVGRRLRHVLNLVFPGKRLAAVLLVSNRRTRDVLPATRAAVVELVENGVDLSMWQPRSIRDTATAPEGRVRFIFLGRLVDWKGVDLLLEAWAAAHIAPATELQIIGDGPMRGSLLTLRDRLGLGALVEFVGQLSQEECSRRLRQADVLVLPSLLECGGAVVLEAMATGLPVIATDWGGPADYLDDSCGILVPPTSRDAFVQGLTRAIERLASSPQLRLELGRAALRRVQAFSWEAKIDRILEIFHTVTPIGRRAASAVPGPDSTLEYQRP